jgi:hypothetical protein
MTKSKNTPESVPDLKPKRTGPGSVAAIARESAAKLEKGAFETAFQPSEDGKKPAILGVDLTGLEPLPRLVSLNELEKKAFDRVKVYHGKLDRARSMHVAHYTSQTREAYIAALQIYLTVLSEFKEVGVFDSPGLLEALQKELADELK